MLLLVCVVIDVVFVCVVVVAVARLLMLSLLFVCVVVDADASVRCCWCLRCVLSLLLCGCCSRCCDWRLCVICVGIVDLVVVVDRCSLCLRLVFFCFVAVCV